MVALRRLPGKRSFYFHCIIWNNLSGLKGAVSAKEELFQGRGEHFVRRAGVLIFQGEMLCVILRGGRTTVVDDKWGLVQRQLRDFGGEQARGLKGQHGSGGMAEDER